MPNPSTPPTPHRNHNPIRTVVSSSPLYPFKGIYYFLTHVEYWSLFGRRLLPLTITSIVVLGLLFTFAYLPQVALLAIFHGPLAWFNAAILVLGEGQVVIALLFEAFLVDETLVDVFDTTLIREGQKDLVSPHRILHTDAPNTVKSLGKPTSSAIYSPFSLRQILEFIIFLPLNLIPVVGTPFFLLITGTRAGPLHHYRYFQLRGLSKKQKQQEISARSWSYTWFGTVALVLQLVPVLSMFFLLTTACGSALWAARLEEQHGIEEGRRPEGYVDEDVDAPPAYTDDVV